MRSKGPDRQTTVDMSMMRGSRSGFIFQKHWREYEQEYHHQIQLDRDRSSLSQSPNIKMEKQADRDSTSHMKAAFKHFNTLRREKEQRRMDMNH